MDDREAANAFGATSVFINRENAHPPFRAAAAHETRDRHGLDALLDRLDSATSWAVRANSWQTLAMISVHIMYPKTDDSTFDMDYYCATHMPMLADALGDACKGWGATSVGSDDWEAIGWATVESQDALNAALKEHGAAIMGDVPNYTNVAPQMVIGEIAHSA